MLSKKVAKDLAGVINHLQVCALMLTRANNTAEQIALWRESERRSTVYLLEQYGIELPNARSFQAEQKLRDEMRKISNS